MSNPYGGPVTGHSTTATLESTACYSANLAIRAVLGFLGCLTPAVAEKPAPRLAGTGPITGRAGYRPQYLLATDQALNCKSPETPRTEVT